MGPSFHWTPRAFNYNDLATIQVRLRWRLDHASSAFPRVQSRKHPATRRKLGRDRIIDALRHAFSSTTFLNHNYALGRLFGCNPRLRLHPHDHKVTIRGQIPRGPEGPSADDEDGKVGCGTAGEARPEAPLQLPETGDRCRSSVCFGEGASDLLSLFVRTVRSSETAS